MYEALCKKHRQITLINSCHSLVTWDQEVFMPKAGAALRAEMVETIASIAHRERTSSEYEKALASCIDLATMEIKDPSLPEQVQASIREMTKEFLRAKKLPPEFIKEFAKTTSEAQQVWAEAREQNAFSKFAPYLSKIVDLCRKRADYLGFKDHPYNALVDEWEEGATVDTLTPLFTTLEEELSPLIKNMAPIGKEKRAFLYGNFDHQKQMELCKELLYLMGLSSDISRLDTSSHPFCQQLHPKDIRLTTSLRSDYLLNSLSAAMHEGGHALYEAGLPEAQFGTPLAEYCSLGIHESQSRMWEVFVGQSLPFACFLLSRLQLSFPDIFKEITPFIFYQAMNAVEPSFIRIESDEVCYNLHVALRYEIEKNLIEGSMQVKDLPEMWNEKMRSYFGITPPSDAKGCLQDVHWSCGLFGYFPTYTIGNTFAAQLFHVYKKEYPDWEEQFATGRFFPMRNFLLERVHKWGRRYTPDKLMTLATGEPLSPHYLIDYLKQKYT